MAPPAGSPGNVDRCMDEACNILLDMIRSAATGFLLRFFGDSIWGSTAFKFISPFCLSRKYSHSQSGVKPLVTYTISVQTCCVYADKTATRDKREKKRDRQTDRDRDGNREREREKERERERKTERDWVRQRQRLAIRGTA